MRDENTNFDKSDFRNTVHRFTPENIKTNLALVEILKKTAEKKRNTGTNRTFMVTGAKTLDSSNSGDYKNSST